MPDKNNSDIDDQWSRQIHEGQLQNNSAAAKTEAYTDLGKTKDRVQSKTRLI